MSRSQLIDSCGCDPFVAQARDASYAFDPNGQIRASDAFRDLSSGIKITNLKVFGVSLTPNSDRPYVFVKIETNQPGLIGWGEATLEGKGGSAMACVEDFRDFLVGNDPMQVEHLWQSMYVHTFYRAGPLIGSAMSGIDQALWDIRGKALNVPVYQLLGGPYDQRGIRGYYHVENIRTPKTWPTYARQPSTMECPVSRSGCPITTTNGLKPTQRSIARSNICSACVKVSETPSISPWTSMPRWGLRWLRS